ncbi:nucleotidyltransferase family protein [Ornithinimicrobium sp. W1679]|uniref:nucleotidyltransferase family protein n=1 Tax=Ornithinimicrobium sp. W1679 TaxID=3418770 RepID=UPI003CF7C41D
MQDVPTAAVPMEVRIEFAHAALQHLADREGIDLLHIKGIAFEPRWRSRASGGSDADVLVRPSHVGRFLRALERSGWQRRSTFRTGSASGHAQTYWHDHLGYADIHRFFMGMGRDDETFGVLWSERTKTDLASVPCPTPSLRAQALIFAINEARNAGSLAGPASFSRVIDSPVLGKVEALVPLVQADIGWAAARGELDRMRDHRDYDLWRETMVPTGRLAEWRARIKAEPTWREKVITLVRAPLVNTEHLANTRGHEPTAREVAMEFVDRGRRAAVELWRWRRNPR